jgi:multiple sugar transport system permease protein
MGSDHVTSTAKVTSSTAVHPHHTDPRKSGGIWERYFHIWFISPVVVFLLVLTLVPTIYLFYLSLSRWDVITGTPTFNGLMNYLNLWRDQVFWASLRRTLVFVSASVSSQLILGFAMALLSNRPHIKGIGVVRTLIILPMSITPIVVGLMWRILYNPSFGLINAFLGLLGIVGPEWLGSKDTALLSVILVDIWQWTPFMFLMMTAGLQSLPAEPFEAALVDGASGFQILRLITLPLMKPIILVAVLFRIIDGFKVSTFDSIFIMTKGGPGSITQTLNIYAFLTGFEWFNLGYASAMVVFTLVLLTIIGRLFLRMGVFREEME